MIAMWQDMRYGFRMLVKNPGFTAVAVLTLALGIGANTAIFSLVNAVLLQPLPFENSARLVWVRETNMPQGQPELAVSPPTFLDWRSQQQSFEDIAAYSDEEFVLTGQGDPEKLRAASVSSGFFSVLRIRPSLGRCFLAEEDLPGERPAVILSSGLWHRRFSADANVIGRGILLDDKSYEVIGVMPPGFNMPTGVDLWTPLVPRMANGLTIRGAHILSVIGRLKHKSTLEHAEIELNTITQRIAQSDSGYAGFGVRLISLHEHVTGQVRRPLVILQVSVVLVLLIACINVAGLLLARAIERQQEMAIRSVLGASRARLIRQLLTESMVLSIIGGAVGLLLASWSTSAFLKYGHVELPRMAEDQVNGQIVVVTVLIAFMTGLIFGLVPAMQAPRAKFTTTLREADTGVIGGYRRQWLGRALVTLQVALTLVLLVGAGLMINSLAKLLSVDAGFTPDRVVAVRFTLPASRYPELYQQTAFFQQLIERVEAMPGVCSVGATRNLPVSGQSMTSPVFVEGRPETPDAHRVFAQFATIYPGYFQTMEISLLDGRVFTDRDNASMPPVAIINEALARHFFPGESPIGHKLRTGFSGESMREIVGVVGDVRHSGLAIQAPPQVYEPFLQHPEPFLTLVVRTEAKPSALVAAVRSVVRSIDKDQVIDRVMLMDELIDNSVARPRFYALLLGTFGAIAFCLAEVGIFGVVTRSVCYRRREIGLRMALGAQAHEVLTLIVRQGMIPILLGIGIGLIGAVILTQFLASLLYGVRPTDPLTFVCVSVLLLGVSLLACFLPTRRAARVDPMEALRYE